MENPDFHTPRDQKPMNRSILRRDITPQAHFDISTIKRGLHMREIVIIRVYFLPPPRYFLLPCAPAQIAVFDRFSWLIAQKTCFRVIYVLSGV